MTAVESYYRIMQTWHFALNEDEQITITGRSVYSSFQRADKRNKYPDSSVQKY